MYQTLEEMIVEAAASARPPERLTVSEAAEKYRYLNNIGSYVGPWRNKVTPYMIEPMDVSASEEFSGEVFVGPAQSGKTDALIVNKVVHTSVCEPADLMIVQTSKATARDFSIRRIARLFRHSPKVAETILPGRGNDNVFDVKFKSGSLLTLSWPAINELSGKPIPIVMLTDYDRMPEDIDGEGSPFDLSRVRTRTFGRFGMTIAESSPGFEMENPRWIPQSRHEAPPTRGILALYNRGDRRRWQWRCIACNEGFEPDFKLLVYPDTRDPVEAAEAATMACPHCGQVYHHDGHNGEPGKDEMNYERARWIKDGELWKPEGVVGKAVTSQIASFWLKGVCAHFTNWRALVLTYLQADLEFQRTGSEEALKTTVNTDQGDVYTPLAARADRLPEVLMSRAVELPARTIPEGVRFLIAAVDVQKNRFEVQIHGIGIDGEMWIIDRFAIKKSSRLDDDGDALWLNPASYLEDWDMLISEVIEKTYPLDDDTNRVMGVFHTICDSGGREGVTTNAYNFWRRLRDDPAGRNHHHRFSLLKGASTPQAPRVQRAYPDSERKDRKAGARGEVPVLMVNPNLLKDQAAAILDRTEPGGARITFPSWLPQTFYNELTVEIRTPKGWDNPKKLRNEAWDLLVYALACSLAAPVNIEHLDWTNPPAWAKHWDDNVLIREPEAEPVFAAVKKDSKRSLRDLADKLA